MSLFLFRKYYFQLEGHILVRDQSLLKSYLYAYFSRKLIMFLVSISGMFIVCGSGMLGVYFVYSVDYKHVRPVVVIGEKRGAVDTGDGTGV